jgi:tetratricopeptide (TPR) repeat protein
MIRNQPQGLLLIVYAVVFCLIADRLGSVENSTQLYHKAAKLAIDGNIDESILIFKKVIEINPYYSLGHYGLGKAYLYKEGRIDDAIVHLRRAIALDQRLSRGHFYLGIALMLNKRYVHALHSFNRAYRYDNSIVEALYNIAVIYDIMNAPYKSQKFFEKYIYQRDKVELDIIF